MDHLHISDNEPSSVILRQTKWFQKLKMLTRKHLKYCESVNIKNNWTQTGFIDKRNTFKTCQNRFQQEWLLESVRICTESVYLHRANSDC